MRGQCALTPSLAGFQRTQERLPNALELELHAIFARSTAQEVSRT
jgi:hypothetical protein